MLTATIVVGRYIRPIIVKTFTAAASFVLFSWNAVSTSHYISDSSTYCQLSHRFAFLLRFMCYISQGYSVFVVQ